MVASTDKHYAEADADFVRSENPRLAHHTKGRNRLNYATGLRKALGPAVAGADLVHVHSVDTWMSTTAMRICREFGRPFVLQPHGALISSDRRLKKWAYRAMFDHRNFAALSAVLVSSGIESRLAGAVLPNVPRLVIPLGVDSRLFTASRLPLLGEPTILFLGRIAETKRLDIVLRMVAILRRERPLRLIVAGPLGSGLTYDPFRLAKELGVSDCVDFLGAVDPVARQALFERASAFVLVSDGESFGVAAAEAMAVGVPVIASRHVGLAMDRLRDDPPTVTVLDHQTADSLASAVRHLLDNPARASQLSDAARTVASRYYRWDKVAAAFAEVYCGVLHQASSTAGV